MAELVFDCLFCTNRYSTMEKLFAHNEQAHHGMTSAEKHQAVKSHFSRKDKKEKEMENMIPSASTTGKKGAPSSGAFNPFMKAADIGKKIGAKGKIVLTGDARVNEQGRFGPQIMVGVVLGKTTYDLPVKIGSANHRILEENYGRNPKKWKNKKLNVEVKEYMNNRYVALSK